MDLVERYEANGSPDIEPTPRVSRLAALIAIAAIQHRDSPDELIAQRLNHLFGREGYDGKIIVDSELEPNAIDDRRFLDRVDDLVEAMKEAQFERDAQRLAA